MHITIDERKYTLPYCPPPPRDLTLQPADALLRESDAGQSQHSPQTQYEQIRAAMAKNEHYLACVDGDERKGHIAARRGYQNIKARVDAGLTTAVYVVHSSRLGRDASERLALQRELKKLRVPIYSCQQGKLEDGLVGGVYALMDQQFSVDLAYKIKNAMPQAVKAGLWPARTPLGYKRVLPEGQPYDRKRRPDMVPDEQYAPLVQDIFAKFGEGDWTVRAIVRWLNGGQPLRNPYSPKGLWSISLVRRILRCELYRGTIVWGKKKVGHYDTYAGPVLRSGEDDCGPARHPALIEPELWEAAQMHLQRDEERRLPGARAPRTQALLSGTLVCRACGSPMHRKAGRGVGGRAGAQYVCGLRARNLAPCSEPSCIAARAEPAVLREVMRLRPGRPWDPAAPEDLLGPDPAAEQRGALQTRIAAARREIDANTRLLKELFMGDGADDEETVASIRRDNQRLDREIKALGAQLEALPARPELNISTVHALHERLAEADLAGRVQRAYEAGDVPLLRELLAALVQSATIVERTRWGKKVWLRAAVTWTPQVAALIRAGYLLLDEPAEAPGPHSDEEDAAERARRDRARAAERVRRYRARRRAARAKAAPSPSLDGLLTLDQAARELGMTAGGLRSAIARGRLVPVRLAVYPGRAFVAPEELGRYRAEHLGRRGRRQGTTAT